METIEKIAEEYIERRWGESIDEIFKMQLMEAFIVGAGTQKVKDRAEKENADEIKELNKEWQVSLVLNEQFIINNICRWLNAKLPNYITDDDSVRMRKADFIEDLRNAMQAEKEINE